MTKPVRVMLGVAGMALAGFGGALLRGVLRDLRGGEDWSQLAGVAAIALATICGGLQCLYVGLAGRVRGRINRWLSAMWQSISRSAP